MNYIGCSDKIIEIDLDVKDLGDLFTTNPVYVDGSLVMILGPNSAGSCQSGWIMLELTKKDLDILFSGLPVKGRYFQINPPQEPSQFMGYKGAVKKDQAK